VLGHAVIVREPRTDEDTTDLGEAPEDSFYRFMVRCTYDEAGERVFTFDDIPFLKSSGKIKLAPLVRAVNRMLGSVEDEVKNSAAGPSSASSTPSRSEPAAPTS
jgi:hypothetical protein